MARIGLFYATRQGHTWRISEHIAKTFQSHGMDCDLVNVRDHSEQIVLSRYKAVVITASVHVGKHEREMISFVKKNLRQLQAIPSAFLSVSLSAAGLERPHTSDEEHADLLPTWKKS